MNYAMERERIDQLETARDQNRLALQLVRQRYELPAFSALLRIARTTRYSQNRAYQERVYQALDVEARQRLQSLLRREEGETRSVWDRLKREPGRPTVPQFK